MNCNEPLNELHVWKCYVLSKLTKIVTIRRLSIYFSFTGRGSEREFCLTGWGLFQVLLYLISNFRWLHLYMNLKYLNLSKGGGGCLTSWRPRPCNLCIPLNVLFEVIHYLHVNSFYSLCFPFRFEEDSIRPLSVLELMTMAAPSWEIWICWRYIIYM